MPIVNTINGHILLYKNDANGFLIFLSNYFYKSFDFSKNKDGITKMIKTPFTPPISSKISVSLFLKNIDVIIIKKKRKIFIVCF